MAEAIFPVLGTIFVLAVVLPVSALLTKGALLALERSPWNSPLHGLEGRYLLLTGSSALPLAWFLSAGVHQTETGSSLSCLLDHHTAALCFEPAFFTATLVLALFSVGARVLRRHRGAPSSRSASARALALRLEALIARTPALGPLRGRTVVTELGGHALGTQGLLVRRVAVGVHFAATLSDELLASALAHELEHVRAFDPLRYVALELALALNPLGHRLLGRHAAAWRGAREAHCDREAVLHGAAPLALASALLRAARPGPSEAVALGAADASLLRLRVGLLLAFAEHRPTRCCRRGRSGLQLAVAVLALTLISPHQTGTAALDLLHVGAERALSYLWS